MSKGENQTLFTAFTLGNRQLKNRISGKAGCRCQDRLDCSLQRVCRSLMSLPISAAIMRAPSSPIPGMVVSSSR